MFDFLDLEAVDAILPLLLKLIPRSEVDPERLCSFHGVPRSVWGSKGLAVSKGVQLLRQPL